jgi:decaprenylphospho-beta-D-erythro-pentofuranosid-2-ulose 2-reductase
MKDSLGAAQSLLVLGGTSDIAMATARKLVAGRTKTVYLAGRPSKKLEDNAAELRGLGATVQTVAFDAAALEDHDKALAEVFGAGDVDVVLMAFGVLGDQAEDEKDPARAAAVAHVNYTGAVSSGVICANALKAQGHGALVVLSSVASERARKANFIYGSSKAGLDAFAQGLGDSLQGTGVHVLVVRPGFVTTKMTAGMEKGPLSTTPEAVADAIVGGLKRGSHTVWVPGAMRFVMSGLRHTPRPIFRKLPF